MEYQKKITKPKTRLQIHHVHNENNLGIYQDENIKKIFVIGDIHGDFYAFKQALELTQCIIFNNNNIKIKDIFQFNSEQNFLTLKDGCDDLYDIKWNKEMTNNYIVFAGDLIDRCRNVGHKGCINAVNDENCDLKILKLIFDLDKQAQQYASRVLMVLGNHEILNLDNDFRYVSFKGLYKNSNPIEKIDRVKEMVDLFTENIENVYGILQINNYIIVHGGINHVFFNNEIFNDTRPLNKVEKFNLLLREFINKKNSGDTPSQRSSKHSDSSMRSPDPMHVYAELFNNPDSPFWDRTLGLDHINNHENCKKIFEDNILQVEPNILPNLKILVAHCPQFLNSESINLTDCNEYKGRIWRIDVGMSRAWDKYNYKNIIQLLNQLVNALENKNFPNKLDFYKIQKFKSRKAGLLRIDQSNKPSMQSLNPTHFYTETILENKLVLDYFYDTIFELSDNKYNMNILIYTYLLQDLYLYLLFEYENKQSINQCYNCNDKNQYIRLLKNIDDIKKIYILKLKELNII